MKYKSQQIALKPNYQLMVCSLESASHKIALLYQQLFIHDDFTFMFLNWLMSKLGSDACCILMEGERLDSGEVEKYKLCIDLSSEDGRLCTILYHNKNDLQRDLTMIMALWSDPRLQSGHAVEDDTLQEA